MLTHWTLRLSHCLAAKHLFCLTAFLGCGKAIFGEEVLIKTLMSQNIGDVTFRHFPDIENHIMLNFMLLCGMSVLWLSASNVSKKKT